MTRYLLTFDDGPHPSTTARILDALAASNVSAVFFVVGALLQSPAARSIARRALAEGHMLGNHTFSHRALRGMPERAVRAELERTDGLIADCGAACRVFRPPYGVLDQRAADVVKEMNYHTLLWDIDTLDWRLREKGAWVNHAANQLGGKAKAVVLMHDIHKSTADNLPDLLRLLAMSQLCEVAVAATWPAFLPRSAVGV